MPLKSKNKKAKGCAAPNLLCVKTMAPHQNGPASQNDCSYALRHSFLQPTQRGPQLWHTANKCRGQKKLEHSQKAVWRNETNTRRRRPGENVTMTVHEVGGIQPAAWTVTESPQSPTRRTHDLAADAPKPTYKRSPRRNS